MLAVQASSEHAQTLSYRRWQRGIDRGDDITSSHDTLKCVGHTKTALDHYYSVLALQKALKVMTMRMLIFGDRKTTQGEFVPQKVKS